MKTVKYIALFSLGLVVGYCLRDVAPKHTGTFISQWLEHPTEVGAITPCSDYVVDEIVRPLITHPAKELAVLEVGSGSGITTDKIVAALSGKQYHLDLVEINEVFAQMLKETYVHNDHITIHRADITQWVPTRKYDVIISTLPFNIFDKETIQKIFASYKSWVKPGGQLVFIELALFGDLGEFLTLGAEKKEWQEKRAIITEFREKYLDHKTTVLKSIPPIYVYYLKMPEVVEL